MKVVVEGVFRRRITKKFGPLKSERWQEEPFKWEQKVAAQASEDYAKLVDGFELAYEINNDRVFVRANIRNRPFILGDAAMDEQKVSQFSVLSVAGIEVGGRITYRPKG